MSDPIINKYTGTIYAFLGQGGFFIDKSFNQIRIAKENRIYKYDSTNAVQITFDVRAINRKLGIIKDASNQHVIQTQFDPLSNEHANDSIRITANEFVARINETNVTSIGGLSTLYNDYLNFVNSYFSFPDGFHTLLSTQSNTDINQGVFDSSIFINLIQPRDASASILGEITISGINGSLRYAVDSNTFGNRDPNSTGPPFASDPVNPHNFGLADGFLAGDLIFAPTGITIQLNTVANPDLFRPATFTPSDITEIITTASYQELVTKTENNIYNTVLDPSINLLQRTVTVPLLIQLV
jgi:hypothetical protein